MTYIIFSQIGHKASLASIAFRGLYPAIKVIMKINQIFLISTCMCCMFLLTGCDQQGIHKPLASGEYEQIILPRGDCILCPDADECCCSVSLQPNTSGANIN